MTDRPFNAANRKDIRAAEKAVVASEVIDREVISGLMTVKNGRHWVYERLADAHVFADPFSPDPLIHAYNAGLRAAGIRLFNELVLYAPINFDLMLKEAHERSILAAARRSVADTTEPDANAGFDDFGIDTIPDTVTTQ